MLQTNPITITKELIQIESTNPGTYEYDIFSYIKSYLSLLPDSCVSIAEIEVLNGRNNLMAYLPCENPTSPELVLICHMDTVPVGNSWRMSPFEAAKKNERIYGRGACDMKSGLACALATFAKAALYVFDGHSLSRSLRFIATVDEEDEMRGVSKAIEAGWITADAHVLDTEPSNRRILTGHKGRLWFRLTIHGQAAHASNPWQGADAIAGMAEVISYLRTHISEFPKDNYFGASSLCFGQIKGGTTPYAVSDTCTVTIDFRLVPPAISNDAILLLDRAIAHAAAQIPRIRGSYEITGDRPPIPYHTDSILVSDLSKAYERVLKTKPCVKVFTGYTDSAVIAGALENHNCVSFGPGNLETAHKPDEWVSITDITDCHRILNELLGL